MSAGQNPYLLKFTVYDNDNTTALSGVRIVVRDVTLGEDVGIETTNTNGIAIVNLATLTGAYADDDVLHVTFQKQGKGEGWRGTVDTDIGWEEVNGYMTNYEVQTTAGSKIIQMTVAETGGNARYIDIYERQNDTKLEHVRIGSTLTTQFFYGDRGKKTLKGFCLVRSSKDVSVTMVCR